MEQLLKNFKSRNMNAYFVKNRDEARKKAIELIPKKATIGFGGSATLEEIGILDELRQRKDFTLLDRSKAKPEDIKNLYSQMFSADIFLSGTNAITELGQLVNVDGVGNRVAAITFGPKKVIIVVGKNKITKDLDSALDRIRKIALKKNMERLKGRGWDPENMWGQVSIIERQKDPERMHIIIVDEELGY
jgi:L-lactate utilization protein LutB